MTAWARICPGPHAMLIPSENVTEMPELLQISTA